MKDTIHAAAEALAVGLLVTALAVWAVLGAPSPELPPIPGLAWLAPSAAAVLLVAFWWLRHQCGK